MQVLVWASVRALKKLGIAMPANRPMIAITIMISTSVKPPGQDGLGFIPVQVNDPVPALKRPGQIANIVLLISDYCC
jgi:hypothetical protein